MAPTEWSAIAPLPSRSPGGASWCPHDSVGRHVSGFRCPETDLGHFSGYPTTHPSEFVSCLRSDDGYLADVFILSQDGSSGLYCIYATKCVSLCLALHSTLLWTDHHASARCGSSGRSTVARRGRAAVGAGGDAYGARVASQRGICQFPSAAPRSW